MSWCLSGLFSSVRMTQCPGTKLCMGCNCVVIFISWQPSTETLISKIWDGQKTNKQTLLYIELLSNQRCKTLFPLSMMSDVWNPVLYDCVCPTATRQPTSQLLRGHCPPAHYGYYSYYSPVCCSYPTSQLTEVQHTTTTSMLCGMDTRPAVLACLRFFITLFNIILGVSTSCQYSQLMNSIKT